MEKEVGIRVIIVKECRPTFGDLEMEERDSNKRIWGFDTSWKGKEMYFLQK